MKKLFYTVLVAGLLINSYWVHRFYKYSQKLNVYFTYNELQATCLEDTIYEHDNQLVNLSNHKLKPLGNIERVYLAYIPSCKKWAEYKCWMWERDDGKDHKECQERRQKENELFKK